MEMLERFLATTIWIGAGLMVMIRTFPSARAAYRLQALGEAGGQPELDALGLAVLIVKGLLVPWWTSAVPDRVRWDYGARGPFGMAAALVFGVGLTVAAVLLVPRLGLPHPVVAGVVLAAFLLGLLSLVVRHETWIMAWALLGLDTQAASFALLVGGQQGPVLDGLALAVTLGLAWVLREALRRVAELSHTTDARTLKELVG
jgi:hydrogenase-4 membrane subunit HyfE